MVPPSTFMYLKYGLSDLFFKTPNFLKQCVLLSKFEICISYISLKIWNYLL
jgi:hypothetical protein